MLIVGGLVACNEHAALTQATRTQPANIGEFSTSHATTARTRENVQICIPTEYHTGMHRPRRNILASLIALCGLCAVGNAAVADPRPAVSIPSTDLIQPAALAAILRGGAAPQPVILQVGFRTLYDQAHIPTAEYAGPAGDGQGMKRLRGRTAKLKLPQDADIVVYCGCCPWDHCPNVADAYFALHELGFTHVRVLYIPNNFGDDWVEKGYPVTKGS